MTLETQIHRPSYHPALISSSCEGGRSHSSSRYSSEALILPRASFRSQIESLISSCHILAQAIADPKLIWSHKSIIPNPHAISCTDNILSDNNAFAGYRWSYFSSLRRFGSLKGTQAPGIHRLGCASLSTQLRSEMGYNAG